MLAPETLTFSNARNPCESPKVTVAVPVVLLYVNVSVVLDFPVKYTEAFADAVIPIPEAYGELNVSTETTSKFLVLVIPEIWYNVLYSSYWSSTIPSILRVSPVWS